MQDYVSIAMPEDDCSRKIKIEALLNKITAKKHFPRGITVFFSVLRSLQCLDKRFDRTKGKLAGI